MSGISNEITVMITGGMKEHNWKERICCLSCVCFQPPLCPCEMGGEEAAKLKQADGH